MKAHTDEAEISAALDKAQEQVADVLARRVAALLHSSEKDAYRLRERMYDMIVVRVEIV